jgi:hypothetical protein
MVKSNLCYCLGNGGTVPTLPMPQGFETSPVGSANENWSVGQIGFTPLGNATNFYIYGGATTGWVNFASNGGDIISIVGTANQITASTTAGVATLSLPSVLIAPGSLEVTSGFTVDAGTTSITGTTNINTSGSAVSSIGTGGTGATHIGNATGNTQVTGSLTTSTSLATTNGNLSLGTAGNKIIIATGSNASVGTSGVMAGTPGSVVVATTASSASAKIFFARATAGGTLGNVSISAQDGTGFTLLSDGNETSTFNWWIINA